MIVLIGVTGRRMEKIRWTNPVRNGEVFRRVKEERKVLQPIKRMKTNWNGHILRRNCLLEHGMEGKIEGRMEVKGRLERRHKQPLDELRRESYWNLKGEALGRSIWNTRFGRSYGPIVRRKIV
jgi:hypothetical protein